VNGWKTVLWISFSFHGYIFLQTACAQREIFWEECRFRVTFFRIRLLIMQSQKTRLCEYIARVLSARTSSNIEYGRVASIRKVHVEFSVDFLRSFRSAPVSKTSMMLGAPAGRN
jgi:hypothetical protein